MYVFFRYDYLNTAIMITSPNVNIIRVTGPCEGNPPVTGWFPLTKANAVDL